MTSTLIKKETTSTSAHKRDISPYLLKTHEVCDWLSIGRERLYVLIATKKFPVIRLGARQLRFNTNEVHSWLNAHSAGNQ